MKHKVQTPLQKIVQRSVEFARHKPLVLGGIVLAVVIGFSWLVASLRAAEVLPEAAEAREAVTPVVIKPGGSMIWLGMEVAELSKVIRKEFKIPARIRGMFVISEGTQEALKYGVKTGDVIVSISRRAVPTQGEFIKVANGSRFTGGILLDIFRNGENTYISIPFAYKYGPLMGPNKGSWQLGSPLLGQAFQYGPVVR
ncbi:MAG: hypothetical protein HQL20_03660 [Candidatus Omnitrophica bacterium]|nr:hypothetical protein [Candidatus Omnitrophota bacterium]